MSRPDIILIEGPVDYRVYQRNENDTADIAVKGRLSDVSDGVVECGISGTDKTAAGIPRKLVLNCNKGIFSGILKNIPVGHYSINLKFIDKSEKTAAQKTVRRVAVGDLYLLGGQSNMDGAGMLVDAETPSPNVHCFYYDDRWDVAADPLCYYDEAVDPVHWITPEETRKEAIYAARHFCHAGAGLGVSFGKAMYKYNRVPVGLILCSHGATMMQQWDPEKINEGGGSLYGSMIRRMNVVGGKARAFLWYQGESDSSTVEAPYYRERFHRFVKALRRDLGQPELPLLFAQLSRYHGNIFSPDAALLEWNFIQTEQLLFEKECPNSAVAATIDATLADGIHLNTRSQRRLGVRFSILARRLCFGDTSLDMGPRPGRIGFEDESRTLLRVTFDHVNGRLNKSRKVWGFSAECEGKPILIDSCKVDEMRPDSVLIRFGERVPEGGALWYCKGMNPPCNLFDDAGFTVPVFGPVPLDAAH